MPNMMPILAREKMKKQYEHPAKKHDESQANILLNFDVTFSYGLAGAYI